jgi:chemotaxis protein CheX
MTEADLQIFIKSAADYFTQTFNSPAEIGTPYLKDEDSVILDYTGVIGISGRARGCVYVTSSAGMLSNLLRLMGEEDITSANLADLVGEICNTIAGNARQEFGHQFMISVPVVIEGRPASLQLPAGLKTFVIPILWNGFAAALIIAIDN